MQYYIATVADFVSGTNVLNERPERNYTYSQKFPIWTAMAMVEAREFDRHTQLLYRTDRQWWNLHRPEKLWEELASDLTSYPGGYGDNPSLSEFAAQWHEKAPRTVERLRGMEQAAAAKAKLRRQESDLAWVAGLSGDVKLMDNVTQVYVKIGDTAVASLRRPHGDDAAKFSMYAPNKINLIDVGVLPGVEFSDDEFRVTDANAFVAFATDFYTAQAA